MLNYKLLTSVRDGQFIPAKGGQGHWSFQSYPKYHKLKFCPGVWFFNHTPGLIFLALIITIPSFDVLAQSDNSFIPNGKPFLLVFSDVNYSFNKAGNSKTFELTRAYLGYEYFFSKNISSKVNIDIPDPGVGKLQMIAFIKNAYVQYKNNTISARFGMICVDQFTLQEKQWGYHYIYKSFQDAYNFGPSADLGTAFEFSPLKIVSLDFSVLNVEGYKKITLYNHIVNHNKNIASVNVQ